MVLAVGWPGNADGAEPRRRRACGPSAATSAVDDALQDERAARLRGRGHHGAHDAGAERDPRGERSPPRRPCSATSAAHRHDIVPHGGFTDPEYGGVGLTEEQAREAARLRRGRRALRRPGPRRDRRPPGRVLQADRLDRSSRRVLGAHIVGEQAVEVVQIVADRDAGRDARRATRRPGARLPDLHGRRRPRRPPDRPRPGPAARPARRQDPDRPNAAEWEHSERG